MVLFIMLSKVVLTFESVDEILSVTIQMKASEQDLPVALGFAIFVVDSCADILWARDRWSQSPNVCSGCYYSS